jgi:uncharacterized protein YlxW (UPF0749 family)
VAEPERPDADQRPAGGSAVDDRRAARTTRTVQRNPVPSLLESMNRDYLDPGYAAAAKRKAAAGGAAGPARTRSRSIALVVAACVILGLLLGISAVNTKSNEPRAEKTRSALLEDIEHAQQQQSVLASSAADLAGRLRATQSNLGAAGPLQTVAALENAGQITAVTGPGLRIVLNEAPADSTKTTSGGVILDRDVQLLVNDLWAAGAEAISIGGVRLQPRSAIRQAGGSILVDNRPVFWPITIDAIGDTSGMQVKLIGSPGYGRFSSFAQLYGIEFDLSAQNELSLPAGSGADLLFARPPTTGAPPAQASPPPASAATSAAEETGQNAEPTG